MSITPQQAKAELARRELARRGVQIPSTQAPDQSFGNKAYNFAQETVPYIAGGLAGAAGAPLGPEVGIPAAGLGYAGAKSGLRGVGRMMGYERPATLGQESTQTALNDVPAGMAMESVAPAAKTILGSQLAKKAGTGIAEMFGAIPGVDTQPIKNLFNNPRSLLPEFMGGPPGLKATGEKIGAIESRLGIPGLAEREGEQVLKVKPPKGMPEGTVRIQDPSRAYDPEVLANMRKNLRPEAQSQLDQAMGQLQSASSQGVKETDRQVSARVYNDMKQGKMPDLNETIKAIRGADNRLEGMGGDLTTEESQNKLLLSRYRKQLVSHLSEQVPELGELRKDYAMGKTREAFTSPAFGLMAQSGGRDVSRMGANKLMGPFALTRMASNPAFGALLGASQSPLALGVGTAGVGALGQAAQSPITPYAIQSLLQTLRNQGTQMPTSTQ